jgi:hypothetical protein
MSHRRLGRIGAKAYRQSFVGRSVTLPSIKTGYREYFASLELRWNAAYPLSYLAKKTRLPPSTNASEWSGVYRIFSQETVIDRSCGKDPTGTLYVGMAGSGARSWSILRDRIKKIIYREHHAFNAAPALLSRSSTRSPRRKHLPLKVQWFIPFPTTIYVKRFGRRTAS